MQKVVLLLVLASLALATPLMRTDGGKVKVDFYYESLCPYCQTFMEKSLKIAASTKVRPFPLRTSGRSATSTSIPTEMPVALPMAPAGLSPASTASGNAKET